jgi:hypothetical protein
MSAMDQIIEQVKNFDNNAIFTNKRLHNFSPDFSRIYNPSEIAKISQVDEILADLIVKKLDFSQIKSKTANKGNFFNNTNLIRWFPLTSLIIIEKCGDFDEIAGGGGHTDSSFSSLELISFNSDTSYGQHGNSKLNTKTSKQLLKVIKLLNKQQKQHYLNNLILTLRDTLYNKVTQYSKYLPSVLLELIGSGCIAHNFKGIANDNNRYYGIRKPQNLFQLYSTMQCDRDKLFETLDVDDFQTGLIKNFSSFFGTKVRYNFKFCCFGKKELTGIMKLIKKMDKDNIDSIAGSNWINTTFLNSLIDHDVVKVTKKLIKNSIRNKLTIKYKHIEKAKITIDNEIFKVCREVNYFPKEYEKKAKYKTTIDDLIEACGHNSIKRINDIIAQGIKPNSDCITKAISMGMYNVATLLVNKHSLVPTEKQCFDFARAHHWETKKFTESYYTKQFVDKPEDSDEDVNKDDNDDDSEDSESVVEEQADVVI